MQKSERENSSTSTHDAIIVLGAEVHADGRPSTALRRRVAHGTELLKKNVADRIVFSGGPRKNLPPEARLMRQLAVARGVSDGQIILEEAAQSTLANAVNCSRICRQNGWFDVLLVTDAYHLWRAKILFRIHGINITASAPKTFDLNSKNWRWWVPSHPRGRGPHLEPREVFQQLFLAAVLRLFGNQASTTFTLGQKAPSNSSITGVTEFSSSGPAVSMTVSINS